MGLSGGGKLGELSRIRLRSAPQSAAQMLREAIIGGVLKPGERLIEQKLASKMGIGQPTLREALKELEYQGFVRKTPQRGTYVTKLEKEDYRKILAVRIVLEAIAVGLVARKMNPKDESELVRYVSLMEKATAKSDLSEFHQADVAFHRLIWILADNEYLTRALETTAFQLFAFALLDLGPEVARHRSDAVLQHKGILAGLCSHDPVQARRAFVLHAVKYWNKLYHVGLVPDELMVGSAIHRDAGQERRTRNQQRALRRPPGKLK